MSVEDRMRRFIERMCTSGVARLDEFRGCSAAEITALEQRYNVILPRSYALFLSSMGHAAGKLGNSGEFDLLYQDALRLTGGTLEAWRRSNTEYYRHSVTAFPHRGLVFCARLGNPDYWLIICEGQEDSPVYHFDYEDEHIRFEHRYESVFGFLEELCEDAEHWIRQSLL